MLLPAGLWLLIAAGVPSQHHRRLAAASLIALAIATLTLVGWGYAFAFGSQWRALSLGDEEERWVFLGLHGFLLQDVTDADSLNQLVRLWPLIAAGALLAAGAALYHARLAALAFFTLVVSGLVLPVVACWGWGDGWLAALGERAGLGRGMVDVGRLATVGLATGAASLSWARIASSSEQAARVPQLPPVHFPVRAVVGVLIVMIGAAALSSDFAPDAPAFSSGQFVSSAVAVSVAILAAGLYTSFATRHADVLSAARAALAGVFITSSGGALLPLPVVVGLGLFCGLAATVGYYVVHEQWRWRDEAAIVTSVLVPSAIGLICTGIFANGSYGVAGLLSTNDLTAGQLLAQVAGLFAIGVFALGVGRAATWLLRVDSIRADDVLPSPSAQDMLDAVSIPDPSAPVVLSSSPELAAEQPERASATEKVAPEPARRGLFGRFRRESAAPPPPKQPRKVAYPYRVGRRPLSARPLDGESAGATGDGTRDRDA
jgi:ammonia channel protein AmtB